MRQLGVRDLSISLPTTKLICVGIEPAYKYIDGVKTDVHEGYAIDVVSPDMPGTGFSVKVNEVDENLKTLTPVEFEKMQYNIYAPNAWDVRVAFRAEKAKRVS